MSSRDTLATGHTDDLPSITITSGVSFAVLIISVLPLIKFAWRKLHHYAPAGQVHFGKSRCSSSPRTAALAELKTIRESGLRNSDRVVDLWYSVISDVSNLGHEKWTILEQVFIAALDLADDALACHCLEQLRMQFKKSSRVSRLFGMYLERNNRFEDAQAVYTQLLTDDPTNTLARKRMIAILKSQRKNIEAIDELRQYLKTFMSDFEAWSELADLYLAEGDFKHAAFCMEEMLLSNPHNHLYCQRYAEIKYTEGGVENLELSRAYFAQACQLNANNLRSLYGVLLTCSALDNQSGKSRLDPVSLLSLKEHGEVASTSSSLFQSINDKPGRAGSAFSTQFPSLTANSPELNRHLIVWAGHQIRQIYANALNTPSLDFNPAPRCTLSPCRLPTAVSEVHRTESDIDVDDDTEDSDSSTKPPN